MTDAEVQQCTTRRRTLARIAMRTRAAVPTDDAPPRQDM